MASPWTTGPSISRTSSICSTAATFRPPAVSATSTHQWQWSLFNLFIVYQTHSCPLGRASSSFLRRIDLCNMHVTSLIGTRNAQHAPLFGTQQLWVGRFVSPYHANYSITLFAYLSMNPTDTKTRFILKSVDSNKWCLFATFIYFLATTTSTYSCISSTSVTHYNNTSLHQIPWSRLNTTTARTCSIANQIGQNNR